MKLIDFFILSPFKNLVHDIVYINVQFVWQIINLFLCVRHLKKKLVYSETIYTIFFYKIRF